MGSLGGKAEAVSGNCAEKLLGARVKEISGVLVEILEMRCITESRNVNFSPTLCWQTCTSILCLPLLEENYTHM